MESLFMEKAAFLGGAYMRRRLSWIIAIVFFLLILIFLPSYLLIPRVTTELAEYIKEEFKAHKVEVVIPQGQSWGLVLGYMPKVELVIENGLVSGLPISEARLEAHALRFQPWALYREKYFSYAGSDFLQISARVTESGLNEYFKQHAANVSNLKVRADDQILEVRGTVNLLGVPWNIAVEGAVEIVDQTVLEFVPTGLTVEKTAAPPILLDLMHQYFSIAVDLDKFPFPIQITDFVVQDGGIDLVLEEVGE